MKNKILLAAIALFISSVTYAQQGQRQRMSPEERAKQQTEQMVKDLGLDDAQAQKVKAINDKYASKMSEARKAAGEDRSGMRETMTKLNDKRMVELKKILTKEQSAKFEESEKARMEERKKRSEERGGNSPERRGGQRGTGNK